MSREGPRPIADLLQSGDISRLKATAAERRDLKNRVQSALPADEARHVVAAHIDEAGRLVVGIDSAAWAARVRYSAGELLGKTLKVRVMAPSDGNDAPDSAR